MLLNFLKAPFQKAMMDYHRLREIEREELSNSELVEVPDDFYEQMAELEAESSAKMKTNPEEFYGEYMGVLRSIEKIIAKRTEKIVFFASKGEMPEHLVGPEEDFFMRVYTAVQDFQKEVEAVKEGKAGRVGAGDKLEKKAERAEKAEKIDGNDGKKETEAHETREGKEDGNLSTESSSKKASFSEEGLEDL